MSPKPANHKRDANALNSPEGNKMNEDEDRLRNLIRSEWNNIQTDISSKLENVSTIMNNKLSELLDNMVTLKKNVAKIEASQEFIGKQYDDMSSKINLISEKFETTQKTVASHSEKLTQLDFEQQSISIRLNDLEQQRLSTNMIVSNLVKLQNENLVELFSAICTKVGIKISGNDVAEIRRLPAKTANDVEPILVRFTNPVAKLNFMQTSKTMPVLCLDLGINVTQKLYFNHQLTAENQKILQRCRVFKKQHNWAYSWFSPQSCRIFMKKNKDDKNVVKVIKDSDLDKYI